MKQVSIKLWLEKNRHEVSSLIGCIVRCPDLSGDYVIVNAVEFSEFDMDGSHVRKDLDLLPYDLVRNPTHPASPVKVHLIETFSTSGETLGLLDYQVMVVGFKKIKYTPAVIKIITPESWSFE